MSDPGLQIRYSFEDNNSEVIFFFLLLLFLDENIYCNPSLEPSLSYSSNKGSPNRFLLQKYGKFSLNYPCYPILSRALRRIPGHITAIFLKLQKLTLLSGDVYNLSKWEKLKIHTKIQSTLVISTSVISNNRLSQRENLIPVLT